MIDKGLPLLPPLRFDNMFSEEDLNFLDSEIRSLKKYKEDYHTFEGPRYNQILANLYLFDFEKDRTVSDLILARLPKEVTANMMVPNCRLVESFLPYQIHNDSLECRYDDGEHSYYFIVIPLMTCQAQTIILEQWSHHDHFVEYKEEHDPLPVEEQMTEADYKKYFSHDWPQERLYVSLKRAFDWTRGSVFCGDMRSYHGSNNFKEFGIDHKNMIVLFTKIKVQDFVVNQAKVSELYA